MFLILLCITLLGVSKGLEIGINSFANSGYVMNNMKTFVDHGPNPLIQSDSVPLGISGVVVHLLTTEVGGVKYQYQPASVNIANNDTVLADDSETDVSMRTKIKFTVYPDSDQITSSGANMVVPCDYSELDQETMHYLMDSSAHPPPVWCGGFRHFFVSKDCLFGNANDVRGVTEWLYKFSYGGHNGAYILGLTPFFSRIVADSRHRIRLEVRAIDPHTYYTRHPEKFEVFFEKHSPDRRQAAKDDYMASGLNRFDIGFSNFPVAFVGIHMKMYVISSGCEDRSVYSSGQLNILAFFSGNGGATVFRYYPNNNIKVSFEGSTSRSRCDGWGFWTILSRRKDILNDFTTYPPDTYSECEYSDTATQQYFDNGVDGFLRVDYYARHPDIQVPY